MVSRIGKRKRRGQTAPRMPMKLAAVSVLSLFSPSLMAANINIAQSPLAGVQSTYQPNIVLVPSVEYPTAGGAYSSDDFLSDDLTPWLKGYLTLKYRNGDFNRRYLGYFDSDKCYEFKADGGNNGYFYATSRAQAPDYACPKANEFSGNVLNWGTMSALDMFRKTLTGGNRVYGTGTNTDPNHGDYAEGDGAKFNSSIGINGDTFLRRARFNEGWRSDVGWGREDMAAYRTRMRFRGLNGTPDQLKRYLPHSVVDEMLSDNRRQFGYINENGTFGRENLMRFANQNIYFHNYNFGFVFARAGRNGNEIHYLYRRNSGNGLVNRYLPVVVRVCDFAPFPGEDAKFCVPYGSKYKPEGLIQAKAREGTRFAAFGFLYTRTDDVDGGVLRAPMKYLVPPPGKSSISGNPVTNTPEWDAGTGKLNPNPENAGEGNSGVINYINKFGDRQGYKDTDPSGELYYAAMRYLRIGSQDVNGSVYRGNPNDTQKDGFPAHYDWQDPLKTGFPANSKEPMCRPNTIIWIGDTNTHYDNNLPQWDMYTNAGRANSNRVSDTGSLKTGELFRQIWNWEGRPGRKWDMNRSLKEYQYLWTGEKDGHSPGGVAGLAYWAHINDTRSDIPGNQYQSNFIIDVLEGGHSKEPGSSSYNCQQRWSGGVQLPPANSQCTYGNPWYWAAKYGGFEHGGSVQRAATLTNPNQDARSWKRASTSEENNLFGNDRMPRNFALGNSPENMAAALRRAFTRAGDFARPTQAAPTFTTPPGQKTDLKSGQSTEIISTTYDFTKLTGDVVSERQQMVNNKLQPVGGILWSASGKIGARFHNGSNYANRQVFVRNRGNGFVRFNTANKSNFASSVSGTGSLSDNDVINYTLGDNSKEAAAMARTRDKILGTMVSPTVALVSPIPASERPMGCSYTVDPNTRPRHYVVSANDGMVHVLDASGEEKMALMLSTALPWLDDYASPSYVHRYLNDGTPSVTETCLADGKAHSVAIGSAGKGGAAVYALDVTDLSSPGEGNLMWEFTNADDSDLGVGVGVPYVAKNKDGKAIAIFNSGYNNPSDRGHIFVLNVDRPRGGSWGGQYQKIPLGRAGVGDVLVLDSNKDGVPERLYAGDYDGNLWRVDYNRTTGAWTPSKLYAAPAGSPPMTTRPAAHKDPGGKTYVIAGTGQYMTADALDRNQQNYVYGFFDDGSTVTGHGQLLRQSIGGQASGDASAITRSNAAAFTISQNALSGSEKGWFIELPAGQIVTAPAIIYREQVAMFQAVSRRSNPNPTSCSLSGSTSFINVDLKNGGLFGKPVFDTNGDGVFDEKDAKTGMITFYDNIAVTSAMSLAQTANGEATVLAAMGDTGQMSLAMNPLEKPRPPQDSKGIVRRISWQEIF
ncbi:pilus assembly protein [Eikenella corrodens]|uniref:PilY1 beta-propeller domain-containing protein n=1 Tax=Eikenella corrodens TaxID=539 RepID=A0A3S9SI61_EIKCO|nr:PilC/PilY family type IV pilus protein [Eikenella corrodens]AZR59212.1 hypothetical protein ELB75_03720 [Eikenella corrodens]